MEHSQMPIRAKRYISVVVGGGFLVLVAALWRWDVPDPRVFLVYVTLSLVAATLKVRLPGITGTYSLGFLSLLAGIMYFSLPETLVAGCAAVLMQSVWRAKQRPTMVQILFNMANLCLSAGLSFTLVHDMFGEGARSYRPAVLALAAAVFFVANTGLVSGVLCLLGGKPFGEISQQWYLGSFVYYLIGAVLVGLLPLAGQQTAPAAWLLLVPPLCLAHFYCHLSPEPDAASRPEGAGGSANDLPIRAKFYVSAVIAAGASVLTFGALHWESGDLRRFFWFAAATLLASACKVRLPRMTGTISLGFVLLLVAVSEMRFSEVAALSGLVGVVQTLWRPTRPPKPIQALFNVACLALSTALAYFLCRLGAGPLLDKPAVALLVPAALIQYGCNTMLVAAVLSLVDEEPLLRLWQRCYFWSFPYYLVGAAAAGAMVATSRESGWQPSLLILPLLALVYVSYRLQLTKAARQTSALASGATA
jgi:hypothetical protein